IFCSDHGDMLGDHGLAYKWLMYESVVRVPFFIVPGAAVAGRVRAPSAEDALVSLLDIGPTFLDAAGVPRPARLEGRSLWPMLQGQAAPRRDHVFCEDNYQIMMRTPTHKLVVYLGQEDGEFYDLSADSDERQNLWGDASARPLRDRLERELFRWFAQSVYFNGPCKTRDGGQKLRWPARGDFALHGPNLWADGAEL
ncbi:MAG: sulfatase-like hydrolase/transferase, partial [Opitutaceae bacterium]|nr:sulfatase-like hydrolase/transferase [Opitutaceae bacterium]